MFDRRFIGCALAASLCLSAARISVADCANPPKDLTPEVTRHQSPLPPDKVAPIDAFVAGWLDCIKSGDLDGIKQARVKLTEPLQAPANSAFFKAQYSASLNGSIGPLLDPKQPVVVRLNAMIVAHDLMSEGVADLIVLGLKDANPAVRYWAANTICFSMKQAGLAARNDPADARGPQAKVLEALKLAMATESDPSVLTAMLDGLSCLTIPTAASAMLKVLEDRVTVHVADPMLPVDSEEAALRRLFTQVLSQGKQNVPQDVLKQLARVAWLQMALVADHLVNHADKVDPTAEAGYNRLAQLGENVLYWVIPALNPGLESKLPEKMTVVDKVPGAIFEQRVHLKWKPILVTDLGLQNIELPKPPADAGKRVGGN